VGKTLDPDGAGPQGPSHEYYAYDQTPFSTRENASQMLFRFEGSELSDLKSRYLWAPVIDLLLSDEKLTGPSTPGDIYWALGDNLNTVRDIARYDPQTDTTSIVNHRTFDAFGNITSESNSAVDLIFAYTGRLFDESTGLQNNLNRWYDPTIGRWLSEDPISFSAGDANLHRYCGNSPLTQIDPNGCFPTLDIYVRLIRLELEEGNRAEAARLAQNMYQNIADFGRLIEPLAAKFIKNWLNGAPKNPYVINDHVRAAISDKSKGGPYQRLEAILTEWAAEQSTTSGNFGTSMLPQGGRVHGSWIYLNATEGEYYHALGGFEVDFNGRWKRSGTKLEFTGIWRIRDRYSWKQGAPAYVAGTMIPDDFARLVEEYYNAKPFDVEGAWYGTMVFDSASQTSSGGGSGGGRR